MQLIKAVGQGARSGGKFAFAGSFAEEFGSHLADSIAGVEHSKSLAQESQTVLLNTVTGAGAGAFLNGSIYSGVIIWQLTPARSKFSMGAAHKASNSANKISRTAETSDIVKIGRKTSDEPTIFRQGTFADDAIGWEGNYVKGKEWASDNPLTTPNYAKLYGLPAENTGKPDWVVGGRMQGPYKTRPAPPSHNNPFNTGGGNEVLPQNPNDVIIDWFHMPKL